MTSFQRAHILNLSLSVYSFVTTHDVSKKLRLLEHNVQLRYTHKNPPLKIPQKLTVIRGKWGIREWTSTSGVPTSPDSFPPSVLSLSLLLSSALAGSWPDSMASIIESGWTVTPSPFFRLYWYYTTRFASSVALDLVSFMDSLFVLIFGCMCECYRLCIHKSASHWSIIKNLCYRICVDWWVTKL